MKKKEEIDRLITEAVLEKPRTFSIDGKLFYIFPMTLGKIYLLQQYAEDMGIPNIIRGLSLGRVLMLIQDKREMCCELLAYMTARNEYYSVFDMHALQKRKEILLSLDDDAMATLLINIISAEKTDVFMKHIGLIDEAKNKQKVIKVKERSDKNTFTFGGLSVYGTLIDAAMERYGMSKRQVVWEIDYSSLRLLLADKMESIYVNDDERKRVRISKDRRRVNGDDINAVMQAIQSQTWD